MVSFASKGEYQLHVKVMDHSLDNAQFQTSSAKQHFDHKTPI
jgi:hypothetical protein